MSMIMAQDMIKLSQQMRRLVGKKDLVTRDELRTLNSVLTDVLYYLKDKEEK